MKSQSTETREVNVDGGAELQAFEARLARRRHEIEQNIANRSEELTKLEGARRAYGGQLRALQEQIDTLEQLIAKSEQELDAVRVRLNEHFALGDTLPRRIADIKRMTESDRFLLSQLQPDVVLNKML